MTALSSIMTKLRYRNLKLRAEQFAELYLNPIATVYPLEIQAGQGSPQQIVVLAPHADDETFGAGGAIRFHIEAGDAVHVVLLSSSGKGNANGTDVSEAAQVEERAEEFLEAMQALGVRSTAIIGLPEQDFKQKVMKNEKLNRHLIENQPDVLYLPSLFDNHQDHRVTNNWAGSALNHLPHKHLLIRGYEVWSPLPATAVLDITPYFEAKQQAIRCYKSQLESIRYDHHIAGLNAYRAMTFGNRALYAEAFLEAPAHQYQEFIQKFLAI